VAKVRRRARLPPLHMPHPAPSVRSTAVALMLLLLAGAARADSSQIVAAEALFREGKALMESGHYAEACPKLEESHRLDPSSGTLLRLGYCLEMLGKLASAWATYHRALPEVKAAGNAQRLQFANERIAIVEPKLSRLTVVVPGELASAKIELDGKPFATGSAIPIDGGKHTLTMNAEGYEAWSAVVEIGNEKDDKTIAVPAKAKFDAPKPSIPPARTASTSSVPFIVAFGAAGVFAAGFVGMRIAAAGAYDDYTQFCAGERTPTCNADDKKRTVQRWDTLSWVSGGLALVSAGVGVALIVWPSKSESTAVRLSPTVGATNGFTFTGSF
jgi:hypothetical protein